MRTARLLLAWPIPTGSRLLELWPVLTELLAGAGPARMPVPAGAGAEGPGRTSLAVGEELADGEDDPADPTVLVMTTSGSTGRAKGALLPAAALRSSIGATAATLGGPGQWLLALPAEHIAGLQVLLRSVVAGTEPVIMDTADSFTAAAFTRATARLSGRRRYTSLVPTQLHRVLADPEATLALTSFHAVLVGGAATPIDLADRARARGVRLVATYGMSETCGGCVYDGLPLPGASFELLPEGDTSGGTGRIALTGPMVARGYRGRPDDPAFTPPPRLGSGPHRDRTFTTGDSGQVEHGRLAVVGRIDDLLITGGLKVDPASVEQAIGRLPGVRSVLVTAVPDAEWGQLLVALLDMAPGSTVPTMTEVHHALAAYPPAARPRLVAAVPNLPTLGIGKPDRRAAARLAATLPRNNSTDSDVRGAPAE